MPVAEWETGKLIGSSKWPARRPPCAPFPLTPFAAELVFSYCKFLCECVEKLKKGTKAVTIERFFYIKKRRNVKVSAQTGAGLC
jgi:hypothetical protein